MQQVKFEARGRLMLGWLGLLRVSLLMRLCFFRFGRMEKFLVLGCIAFVAIGWRLMRSRLIQLISRLAIFVLADGVDVVRRGCRALPLECRRRQALRLLEVFSLD